MLDVPSMEGLGVALNHKQRLFTWPRSVVCVALEHAHCACRKPKNGTAALWQCWMGEMHLWCLLDVPRRRGQARQLAWYLKLYIQTYARVFPLTDFRGGELQ